MLGNINIPFSQWWGSHACYFSRYKHTGPNYESNITHSLALWLRIICCGWMQGHPSHETGSSAHFDFFLGGGGWDLNWESYKLTSEVLHSIFRGYLLLWPAAHQSRRRLWSRLGQGSGKRCHHHAPEQPRHALASRIPLFGSIMEAGASSRAQPYATFFPHRHPKQALYHTLWAQCLCCPLSQFSWLSDPLSNFSQLKSRSNSSSAHPWWSFLHSFCLHPNPPIIKEHCMWLSFGAFLSLPNRSFFWNRILPNRASKTYPCPSLQHYFSCMLMDWKDLKNL